MWVAVAYLWFTYVLSNFPLTQPFAHRLSGFLVATLEHFSEGAVAALPGFIYRYQLRRLLKPVGR